MTDKEILNEIRTIFVEKMRSHPKFRGLNPKLLWRDIERSISVDALRAPYQRSRGPARERGRLPVVRDAIRQTAVIDFAGALGRIRTHYPQLSDEDVRELLRIVGESVRSAFPGAPLDGAVARTGGSILDGNARDPGSIDEQDTRYREQTTHPKQGVIAMSHALRLAADHLRVLAMEMAARSPSEDELSKDELAEWKRLFMKAVRKDPRNRGRDVEKMWRDWQRCIPENIGEIVCSGQRPSQSLDGIHWP